jgi:hypothetical protein
MLATRRRKDVLLSVLGLRQWHRIMLPTIDELRGAPGFELPNSGQYISEQPPSRVQCSAAGREKLR